MIALVTGAGGFLGVRLVRNLLFNGHKVIGIDRKPLPHELFGLSGLSWIVRDLCNEPLSATDLTPVDTIFHLAGATLGAGQDEQLFLKTNEATTIGLLQGFAGHVKRVVHASSQVVYGNVNSLTVGEEFPLLGWDSAYACSKVNVENWLRWFHYKSGGSYVALRFSGFLEGGGAVDYMVAQALQNLPIELFSMGRICRDYISAEKGIEALVAASALPEDNDFQALNIGSGQALTTTELAQIVCEEIGSLSKIIPVDKIAARANFVFNIAKARAKLGFEPGSLAEAVRSYVRDRLKRSHNE